MKTKVCWKCKQEKSIDQFNKSRKRKDGLDNKCKKCNSEINREWSVKNKDKRVKDMQNYYVSNKDTKREYNRRRVNGNFEELKIHSISYKGGQCIDCGKKPTKNTLSHFEFHHLDPSLKVIGISDLISKKSKFSKENAWVDIKQELDKCVLLCKPCHNKRHSDYKKGLRQTL